MVADCFGRAVYQKIAKNLLLPQTHHNQSHTIAQSGVSSKCFILNTTDSKWVKCIHAVNNMFLAVNQQS